MTKLKSKYILKDKKRFKIVKTINKKVKYFGIYETEKEACRIRDLLIKHDWDKKYLPKKPDRNIYFQRGKYEIRKVINKKKEYFGRYNSKEEAKSIRNLLEKDNWNKENIAKKPQNPDRYIYCLKEKCKIEKIINKKKEYFGTYDSIEEAKPIRDQLEKHNWNKKYIPQKPQKQDRYIHFHQEKYEIEKIIKNKPIYFGRYDSIEKAREVRDQLEKHNWNKKYIPPKPTNPNRYLNYKKSSVIIRKINKGKLEYYGTYKTLKEAREVRDKLEKHDWDKKYIPEKVISPYSNIYKRPNGWAIEKIKNLKNVL